MTVKDTNFWLNEQELKTPEHDEMVLWTFNNWTKIRAELNLKFPNQSYDSIKPSIYVESETIEYPIKSYNGFNLGYLDLLIKIGIKDGYFLSTNYGKDSHTFNLAFEIKPNVKSFGEVLRQFQYYKSNMIENTTIVLVTKTKGLKKLFESQGFYVYEYGENRTEINKTLV